MFYHKAGTDAMCQYPGELIPSPPATGGSDGAEQNLLKLGAAGAVRLQGETQARCEFGHLEHRG